MTLLSLRSKNAAPHFFAPLSPAWERKNCHHFPASAPGAAHSADPAHHATKSTYEPTKLFPTSM